MIGEEGREWGKFIAQKKISKEKQVALPLVPGLFCMALSTACNELHLIIWCINHQFPWKLHEDKSLRFFLLGVWVLSTAG